MFLFPKFIPLFISFTRMQKKWLKTVKKNMPMIEKAKTCFRLDKNLALEKYVVESGNTVFKLIHAISQLI